MTRAEAMTAYLEALDIGIGMVGGGLVEEGLIEIGNAIDFYRRNLEPAGELVPPVSLR